MKIYKAYKQNSFYFFILLTSLLFTFNSCDIDDTLTVDKNPNELSEGNFWETGDDAQKALNGAYASLPEWGLFGRTFMGRVLIHRGDIVDPYPQPPVNSPGTFTMTASNPAVNSVWGGGWGALYKMVSRANRILDRIPNIEMDAESKEQILGQAYFLRGLAYFYLVNGWENIPYTKKSVNNLDDIMNVPQTSPDTAWTGIKSDFQEAQSRLPETWPASEGGRATWGAATAMLGKSYLYTQEWTNAATELEKVIDSNLYGLVEDYQWNFLESQTNNKESIFEIQYIKSDDGALGASGAKNNWKGQMWEPDIAPTGYTSQQSVDVNQWVFDLFMQEKTVNGEIDPRAYATIVWNYPGAKVYQDDFQDAFEGENLDKIWVRKYLNYDDTNSLNPGSWAGSTNNYRMIRLGGVLLMYAEAQNEASGPNNSVYDAINKVRERASMSDITPGLSQSEMRQTIRDERVRELAIEGHRYFDLKRWGIMYDRFSQHPEFRANSGGELEEYEIILPLPQNDIDSNPNLTQNPGYQ